MKRPYRELNHTFMRWYLPLFSTVLIETDFLKYNGTIENSEAGNAEANVGPANVNIEGKGLHKLASSFGSLTKQEVDVQKLLCDTKNR